MAQGAQLVFGAQTPESGTSLAVIQVPENVAPPQLIPASTVGKNGSTFPAGIWNSQSGKFPCL